MTKAQLEEQLQEAVNFGNEMVEFLEEMRNDPVMVAYRERMREMSQISAFAATPADPLDDLVGELGRWDVFVGTLQRMGVVDKELMAMPAEATLGEVEPPLRRRGEEGVYE